MKLLEQCNLVFSDGNLPRQEKIATTSTKVVRGLELDGMANKGELLINVVRKNKPKVLRGLSQKAISVGTGAESFPVADNQHHRRIRQSLTHLGMNAERGKPVISPSGKANRKVSSEDCG